MILGLRCLCSAPETWHVADGKLFLWTSSNIIVQGKLSLGFFGFRAEAERFCHDEV